MWPVITIGLTAMPSILRLEKWSPSNQLSNSGSPKSPKWSWNLSRIWTRKILIPTTSQNGTAKISRKMTRHKCRVFPPPNQTPRTWARDSQIRRWRQNREAMKYKFNTYKTQTTNKIMMMISDLSMIPTLSINTICLKLFQHKLLPQEVLWCFYSLLLIWSVTAREIADVGAVESWEDEIHSSYCQQDFLPKTYCCWFLR